MCIDCAPFRSSGYREAAGELGAVDVPEQGVHRSRRNILGSLLVGLLAPSAAWVYAADELLDPGRIGEHRNAAKNEGLLDPGRVGGASNSPGLPGPVTGGISASYGANMASSVVNSLEGLTRSASELLQTIKRLEVLIRDLVPKLDEYRKEKEKALEEYRLGLFCSGCGRTKSDIESKGEQFPHPGQKIIKATPEQIARKEAELQRPIDQTDKSLKEAQAKLKKARMDYDEVADQIVHGASLWRTGISFELFLIKAEEERQVVAYRSETDKVLGQLRKLEVEATRAKTRDAAYALGKEAQTWSEALETIDQRRQRQKQKNRRDYEQAAVRVKDEINTLTRYLSREGLGQAMNVPITDNTVSPIQDGVSLGAKYRMGDSDPERHGNELSQVQEFIGRFRQLPMMGNFSHRATEYVPQKETDMLVTASAATRAAACTQARLMAEDPGAECDCEPQAKIMVCRVKVKSSSDGSSLFESIKKILRNNMKACDPAQGDDCEKAPKGGNATPGVRG